MLRLQRGEAGRAVSRVCSSFIDESSKMCVRVSSTTSSREAFIRTRSTDEEKFSSQMEVFVRVLSITSRRVDSPGRVPAPTSATSDEEWRSSTTPTPPWQTRRRELVAAVLDGAAGRLGWTSEHECADAHGSQVKIW